jgi:hypothetical protein
VIYCIGTQSIGAASYHVAHFLLALLHIFIVEVVDYVVFRCYEKFLRYKIFVITTINKAVRTNYVYAQ